MTWGALSDELSREWKRFQPFEPELSRELLSQLKNSERYTEIEVQNFSLGGKIGELAADVSAELFLRFDVALQYIREKDPREEIPGSRDAAIAWLLDHVWHKVGLPALREGVAEMEKD